MASFDLRLDVFNFLDAVMVVSGSPSSPFSSLSLRLSFFFFFSFFFLDGSSSLSWLSSFRVGSLVLFFVSRLFRSALDSLTIPSALTETRPSDDSNVSFHVQSINSKFYNNRDHA